MTSYDYALSSFANQKVDTARLQNEIETSTISVALNNISEQSSAVTVSFKDELSVPQKSILDGIVGAHTGAPLGSLAQLVQFAGPTTADDDRPIFQPSVFPSSGVYMYITGAADDAVLGRGNGPRFALESNAAGDTTQVFTFLDWLYISDGALSFEGGVFGDYANFTLEAPATPVTPNLQGTGNYRLVDPGVGAAILIVPSPGTGTIDVDLSHACPVPAFQTGLPIMNGFFDWTEPPVGKGVITPSGNPGHAPWNLFAAPLVLNKFVNKIPLIGTGTFALNLPPMKSKKILPQWQGRCTLHNSGHAGLKVAWTIYAARAVTY